jgi:thioredoxin reductase (NADPH)
MILQAEAFGAKISAPIRAVRFELQSNPKVVWTREREYRANAVLIAIGVQRRRVEIKGARELLGMGVSYCPVCDGTFFKGKDVALIGEDNEAIQDGLYLSELVNKIHLIPGSLTPRYNEESLKHLLSKGKVEYWRNFETVEIVGKPVLERIRARDLDTNQESEIPVKGVFISGENTPTTQMLADAGVKTDPTGCIGVDTLMQTNIEGVFAAGDATCSRKYQVAVSVGQGAIAALNIIKRHAERKERAVNKKERSGSNLS